jgi:phage terminase large subunit-like protein
MICASDHSRDVQGYIDDVLANEITTSRLVGLAVKRHVADLKKTRRKKYPYKFESRFANEAIDFLQLCPQSKGRWAGQLLKLEPWQKFIAWCVFGWRRKADGTRRFRKAFITLGRKNGKSTLCAAIALLLMLFDNPLEGGAEVYVVATKEEQARIVHEEAKRMVRRSLDLGRYAEVFTKAITCSRNDGSFKPLGSDSDQSGFNPHGVIKDELHAWRDRHRNLFDEMSTGGASRAQPLEVIITTAGDDKSNIWKEELDYATRIVEAVEVKEVVNDTVFAYIACLDKDDDPFDESVWVKANPNIGVSVSVEYLREQAVEAKGKPTSHNAFLRYHCNICTTSHERAILPELWAAGAVDQSEHGEQAFGGIDLGRSDDFAALAIVSKSGDKIRVWAESYTCQERCKELQTPEVQSWIDRGFLIEHEGDAIDFTAIEQRIVELSRGSGIRIVNWASDPTFAGQLLQRLQSLHGLQVYEFIQTARSYNEPIRSFLRELKAGSVLHGPDPCLTWQARNITIRRNAQDLWMPEKGVGWQKIDAIVATLMAYAGIVYHKQLGIPAIY